MAVSPDGRSVVFAAISDGESYLWLRSRDSVTARRLEGTAGARSPFWSPDNRAVGFFAGGKLKRLSLSGGLPLSLADAGNPFGGTWNADDVILFVPYAQAGLFRVPAGGGEARQVSTTDETGQGVDPLLPRFLPDGRHFVYRGKGTRPGRAGIYVGSLDRRESTFLFAAENTKVEYTPGYLVFVKENSLVAQPFDARRLAAEGPPIQAAERIAHDEAYEATFSVSETGVLAYWGVSRPNGQIVLTDRTGKQLAHFGEPGEYVQPTISPDGNRLAVEHLGEAQHNIWLIDWPRRLPSRFAMHEWGVHNPMWSPDGRWIAYGADPGQGVNLYRRSVAGDTRDEQLTFLTRTTVRPDDWMEDVLVYEETAQGKGWDLWYVPLSAPRKPVPFLQTEFSEVQGHLSPNGRWLAYTSDESGALEVYVTSFPSPGEKHRVSSNGGAQALWRRDGKEIFYLSADRHIMAASLESQSPLVLSEPKALFATGITGPIAIAPVSNNSYAVTADGQHFYVDANLRPEIAPITVVLNWKPAPHR